MEALTIPTGEKIAVHVRRQRCVERVAEGGISLATATSSVPTGVNSPDRRLTDNGYFCNQYGYIAYDDYGVQYSYGKSPGTDNLPIDAYLVYLSGSVSSGENDGIGGVQASYGRFIIAGHELFQQRLASQSFR